MGTKIFGSNRGIATSNAIPDNTSEALDIQSTDAKDYITIDTTDGAEVLSLEAGGSSGQRLFIKAGQTTFAASGLMSIQAEDATSTNPVFCPNSLDTDTGIGRAAADRLSLIAGGTEALRLGGGGVIGKLDDQVDGTFTATNGSAEITSGSSTAFTTDLHVGSAIELFEPTTPNPTSRGVFTVTAIDSGGAALTLDGTVAGLSSSPRTGMTGKTDSGELFAVKTGDSKTLFSVEPDRFLFESSNYNVVLGSNTAGEDLTTGDNNLFVGRDVGQNVTTGEWNTLIGNSSVDGFGIVDPDRSVVVGAQAGRNCGDDNVYVGTSAGQSVAQSQNVGVGASSMTVDGAEHSVGIGYAAHKLCTGSDNVAVGHSALTAAGDADNCVALGANALAAATNNNNIGIGKNAGNAITSGSGNICIGGDSDATAGSASQVAIGADALANGTNCIALGSAVTGAGSHTVTIGDTQMIAVVNEQSGFDRTACLGDPARPWGGLMTGAKQFFSTPQDCSAVNTTDTGVIKQFNAFGSVSQVKIPAYSIISNVSVTIYDSSGASTHNAAVYTSTTSGTAAGSAVAGTVVEILGAGAAGTRSTDTTGSATDIDLKATKGKTWYNETKFHVGSADVYVYVASAGTSNSGTAGDTSAMLTVEFIGLD